MAFTTEFTQAQVQDLTNALASGILTIEHGGKRTTFQSEQEMIDLRDRMKAEIEAAANAASMSPKPMPHMTRPTIFFRT